MSKPSRKVALAAAAVLAASAAALPVTSAVTAGPGPEVQQPAAIGPPGWQPNKWTVVPEDGVQP